MESENEKRHRQLLVCTYVRPTLPSIVKSFFSLLIARIEGRPQLFLCICPAWVKNGSRETGFSVNRQHRPFRWGNLPITRLSKRNGHPESGV
jgi:hypothetical protein